MNYVYAYTTLCKRACVLGGLHNVEKDYELLRGISRKDDFPKNAFFKMDSDFGNKLQDVLKNGLLQFVISAPMKEFFEKENLKNNELLPVCLRDKKDQAVEGSYFILQQTVLQNCLDLEKTVVTKNPINPDLFIDIERLVVDEDKIDSQVSIFRPHHHPGMLIVERGLSERIMAAGFTGIGFGEIDQYDQFETL